MKKLITIIAVFSFLLSCKESTNRKYLYSVQQKNGKGFSAEWTFLGCDSATMISTKEAIAYVDGVKIRVFTDQITISTNTYLK